jgi:Arc/MetJ-type ribon-helix-helix transcriptional regulator
VLCEEADIRDDSYTQALTCSPTEAEVRTLKLNRAIAYLQIGLHNAALLDVDSAPPSDALVDKALIRKANALYGLGRYQDCCEVLNVLIQDFPDNKTGRDTLSRAMRRIKEQESGKYDFKQMPADAARLKPPHLDYATYIGPVTVKSTETMGRGLFTTKDVKVGDLLLCEKAFVLACPTADEPPVVRVDPEANLRIDAAQVKLINLIVEKISRDPAQAAILADLDRGSYKRVDVSEVDGAPVVDA